MVSPGADASGRADDFSRPIAGGPTSPKVPQVQGFAMVRSRGWPDMVGSGHRARVLIVLLLRLRERRCRRQLYAARHVRLSRRQRSPRTGGSYHALRLDNPGTCLMFAAESLDHLAVSVRLGHLDVKATLRARDYAIGYVHHRDIMALLCDNMTAQFRNGRYLGRRVIRFRVATWRKNSFRGCAGLPSNTEPAGASEMTPLWAPIWLPWPMRRCPAIAA